jgi:hypothetical protein
MLRSTEGIPARPRRPSLRDLLQRRTLLPGAGRSTRYSESLTALALSCFLRAKLARTTTKALESSERVVSQLVK